MLNLIPGVPMLKKIAIGAAVALVWTTTVYMKGRADGRSLERVETFAAIEAQRQQRNDINETVRNLDDAALCADLGGVFTDGKCE